jgi:hypothetical protein
MAAALDPQILTPLDESFGHQLVAPRAVTQHDDPRWAERAYFLLHVDDGLTINAGRQLYRHAGHWTVFAAAATPQREVCLRTMPPFAKDDDPDGPRVGPITLEVERAFDRIHLVLDEPDFPLSYDLTFEARFPPVAHDPTLVERDGEVMTNSMSFFQSGAFNGTVVLDGEQHEVVDRAGFRDRSWGLRKHDGAPRRGFVVFMAAEFDGESLYVLLHETASGRRAYTGGWAMTPDGAVDNVVAAEHDLDFAEAWIEGGRLRLEMESGKRREIAFETQTRLFLSGVGYSPDPESKKPGTDDFDLTDPAVAVRLEGQTDHGSRFTEGDRVGHGYVEVGRGIHPRYRPEAPAV